MKHLAARVALGSLVVCCALSAHAGLMAYWSFDDGGGGTLADNSGRANDGALAGTSLPTWVAGHSGQAGDYSLNFTGGKGSTAPHVRVGDQPDLRIDGDQTIAMWLKPDDFGPRRNPYAKEYAGAGTITQNASSTGTASLTYYYGDKGVNGAGFVSFGAGGVVKDSWNHVVIVRNLSQSTMQWYVNGALTTVTPPKPTCVAGHEPVYIGRGYVDNYSGEIDDVAVWNEALRRMEVRLLTQQTLDPLTLSRDAGVVAYTYSAAPNAHTDYYKDEAKDAGSPTGDLTDGMGIGDNGATGYSPDDTIVGWNTGTPVDITFELETPDLVDAILIGYSVYFPFSNDAPDDVQVSFSDDGVNFSTPATYTGFTGLDLHNDLLIDIDRQHAAYVRLGFDGGTANGRGKYLLDEVMIFTVPEPASLSLLGLGALGLLRRMRRRRDG